MAHIYLISPPQISLDDFAKQLEAVLAQTHKVAAFQLRLKEVDKAVIMEAAKRLKPICHAKQVAFIINDDLALAKEVQADGVHLGEEDGYLTKDYLANCRTQLGEHAIIGVSCYDSKDRAMQLADQGADYVSFGAFFPTRTKEAKAQPDMEILTWWSTYTVVPCCAIGGINAQNAGQLVKAGADFIAVISSVWEHEEGAVQAILQLTKAVEANI